MNSPSFQIIEMDSTWIHSDKEKRLGASSYTKDAVSARLLLKRMKDAGLTIDTVGGISEKIFHRPRFKRKYVSEGDGQPFLTPSSMFTFPIRPEKFICAPPGGLKVFPGWILVTCSGSIGRSLIVDESISECVLSHDLIRVVPQDGLTGYLYLYLNTWVGLALLTKDKYGMTVKHIEPHHVSALPIPIISSCVAHCDLAVKEIRECHRKAQEYYSEAERLLLTALELPEVDKNELEYLDGKGDRFARCFEISSKALDRRLDAKYYAPITKAIISNMEESKYGSQIIKLGATIDRIFVPNRMKRPYVKDESIGIPFLQGSHIEQWKTFDVKFIWNKTKGLQNMLLKKNWILMTRSGTVGRLAITRNAWDGWAASEHIFRIVIKEGVHPGYILAFLYSPYGQQQIMTKIYGAVVDEIGEKDTNLIEEIQIILPDYEVQEKIGDLIVKAFDCRDKANTIEKEAINKLEAAMDKSVGLSGSA